MARENTSYLDGRDAPKKETATRARQGSTGRPVLVILIVSVLLALVVWAVVEYADGERPRPAAAVGIGELRQQSRKRPCFAAGFNGAKPFPAGLHGGAAEPVTQMP